MYCRNLLDRDVLSKSDPVCVVYTKDLRTNQYIEIGRTEQIQNNLNPNWNTKFTVDYRFEERQVAHSHHNQNSQRLKKS
jgi:hypothetical protein